MSKVGKGKERMTPEMLRQYIKDKSSSARSAADYYSKRRQGDSIAQQPGSGSKTGSRLNPEQLAQLPSDKREEYERYLAAKAREIGREPRTEESASATSSGSPQRDDVVQRAEKGTRDPQTATNGARPSISSRSSKEDRTSRAESSSNRKTAKIRLEDLTPEQVERLQKAREVRKREAARAAKEAQGEGSSGLSVDEKAELSAS